MRARIDWKYALGLELTDPGFSRRVEEYRLPKSREVPGRLVPLFFIGAGNGLALPSGIAGAVSVRPELAGAAGLSGTLQIGSGALVSPLVGATLDMTVWPLITVVMVCSTLAPASLGLVARRSPSGPAR